MSQKPRVLIATPTPVSVKTRYMKGIIGVMRDLGRRGIDSDYATADGSELVTLRNDLAAFFLARPADTHLLFVDSDMVFPPDLCARMSKWISAGSTLCFLEAACSYCPAVVWMLVINRQACAMPASSPRASRTAIARFARSSGGSDVPPENCSIRISWAKRVAPPPSSALIM